MTRKQIDSEVLRLVREVVSGRIRRNIHPACCPRKELVSHAYHTMGFVPQVTEASIERLVSAGELKAHQSINDITYYIN